MSVMSSEAVVATDRPARYGKQLVAHLSRRVGGEWSEEEQTGRIDFPAGRATLSCEADSLQLRVVCAEADLDRLEDVVGRHLVRFGTRDELVVSWIRSDGRPGSEQRNLDDAG